MKPAERIDLITRCALQLQSREGWGEIDFVLDQFGMPTSTSWQPPSHTSAEEDRFLYSREMLSFPSVQEIELLELDAYLSGARTSTGFEHHPWREGSFRLFLSHVAAKRAYAAELKQAFARYGVDAFVAHDDIEPGAEWLRTILAALHSCEGLVAILHTGFRESNWCDQEVGVALGTGVPCVPLRVDFNPYGFLGAVQAVPGTDLPVASVAESIVAILATDKRTAESITEAAVRRLAAANSWNQANMLARFLQNHLAGVTRDHIQRLRSAQKANAEVGGAFDVEPMLAAAERRLPPVPAPPGHDEEPF